MPAIREIIENGKRKWQEMAASSCVKWETEPLLRVMAA